MVVSLAFGDASLASPYVLASSGKPALVPPNNTLVLWKTYDIASPNALDSLVSPEEAILAFGEASLAEHTSFANGSYSSTARQRNSLARCFVSFARGSWLALPNSVLALTLPERRALALALLRSISDSIAWWSGVVEVVLQEALVASLETIVGTLYPLIASPEAGLAN